MVLICQVVVKEVSFEWSHYRISLNLNQPVQYYINYIPGGGGTVLALHYGLYRGGGGGGGTQKGYLFLLQEWEREGISAVEVGKEICHFSL